MVHKAFVIRCVFFFLMTEAFLLAHKKLDSS